MVDKELRELRAHGDSSFPIDEYDIVIPRWNFLDNEGLLLECHWHSEWELFSVVKGSAKLFVNGEKHILECNDIALIPGNCIHMAYMAEEGGSRYHSVVFSMDFFRNGIYEDLIYTKYIEPLCKNTLNLQIFPYSDGGNDESVKINALFSELFATLANKPMYYELLTKSIMYRLFASICGKVNVLAEDAQAKMTACTAHGIINAVDYMKDNLQKEIQVTQLAGAANMSVGHFRTLFKQMTSLSPIEYLLNLRLNQASLALINSNEKISSIALESGFNNVSYFNRSFKAKYGSSPKEYRTEKQAGI